MKVNMGQGTQRMDPAGGIICFLDFNLIKHRVPRKSAISVYNLSAYCQNYNLIMLKCKEQKMFLVKIRFYKKPENDNKIVSDKKGGWKQ